MYIALLKYDQGNFVIFVVFEVKYIVSTGTENQRDDMNPYNWIIVCEPFSWQKVATV